MKQLRRLLASYQRMGLQVVGINVDRDRADVDRYLRQTCAMAAALRGWWAGRKPSGTGVRRSDTANHDADCPSGKVIRHNVRAAELQSELEKIGKAVNKVSLGNGFDCCLIQPLSPAARPPHG